MEQLFQSTNKNLMKNKINELITQKSDLDLILELRSLLRKNLEDLKKINITLKLELKKQEQNENFRNR
jgi:hypothetical protein